MTTIHISDLSSDRDSFLTELKTIERDRISGGSHNSYADYNDFPVTIIVNAATAAPLAVTPVTTTTDGHPITFSGPGFSYTTNTYAGGKISYSSGKIGNGSYFFTSGAIPAVSDTTSSD